MKHDVPFSSKRFLLTLTLCACSVILLENHDLSPELSFPSGIAAMLTGLGVCFLFLLPAMLLKKRFDSDVLTLVSKRSKAMRRVVAAVYSLCFLYVAAYFLLPYTDMFCKKYYPETTRCLIALLLLACSIYAAYKGVNVVTRFGIFLFVLAMVTNGMMFGGCLSSLDFENGSFGFSGSLGAFGNDVIYFVTPCFVAALFGCLSGNAKRFRIHQVVVALGLTGLKYALVLFFLTFSVGAYAERQEYPTFVLSRVAHFGEFAGIESLYMALSTMSVFMILALLLCVVTKAWGKEGKLWLPVVLTGVIFAVQLLAENYRSVEELFTQPMLLNALMFVAAVVMPLWVGWLERRQHA